MGKSLLPLVFFGASVVFSGTAFSQEHALNLPKMSLPIKSSSVEFSNHHVFSLEELCLRALEKSPRVMAKRYGIEAQNANLKLNRINLLPGVSLTSSFDKSGGTDLFRFGADFSWSADLSKLLGRDIALARNGLLQSQEFERREEVWVLNGVEDLYRSLAVLSRREGIYENVISLTKALSADIPGFAMERDLKIEEYETELTRIQNRITEQTSRLSALAFGDPYNGFIGVDMNYLHYDPLVINRPAMLRRAVKERMRPEVFDLRRHDILMKLATRNWQPKVYTSYNYGAVKGTADSYVNPNSSSFTFGIRILFDLPGRNAAHSRARANKAVAEANTIVGLNNLINGTYLALDRYEQARDNLLGHIKKYGDKDVDFFAVLSLSYPDLKNVDRNVFQTVDLYLKNALKLVDYFSEYRSAIIDLNNHLMLTPLTMHGYRGLELDEEMPEIFSHLPIPEDIYKKHKKKMLGN